MKEKLIRNINPKSLGIKDSHGHTFQKTDHFADKNEILKTKSQLLPLVSPKLKGLKQETNYREIKQYRSYPSVSTQRIETGEFQYLSPKARQKMNSESVPILMSNVFLTGLINPSAFANQDEATIEYIITEHHEKTKHSENNSNHLINQSLAQRTEKKKLGKLSVAMSVSRQDKKIKKGEITLNSKTQKIGMDKIGMKLRATVGHLRMERELKRKKILSLLRTKNFNLFRTNTINNLHLLKEVL